MGRSPTTTLETDARTGVVNVSKRIDKATYEARSVIVSWIGATVLVREDIVGLVEIVAVMRLVVVLMEEL